MFTEVTLPYRPLPELRQEIEALLQNLCRMGEFLQRESKFRPQSMKMATLHAIAWAEPEQIPLAWRRPGVVPFGLSVGLPRDDGTSVWAIIGGVERVAQCICGKHCTLQEESAGMPIEEESAACPNCRYRMTFTMNRRFPFTLDELLAAVDHYLCRDEQLVLHPTAPWPIDPTCDGFALLDRQVTATQLAAEQAAAEEAAQEGNFGGHNPRHSSAMLEHWMRSIDNPKEYKQFRADWERLRRQEPGFEELLDLDKAFERVAKRCLDRIFGE